MGVAGSGKSAVGEALAEALGAGFVDADAVHPPENVAKMSAGIPLTDDDRWPWLDRLRGALAGSERMVVTCSALRRRYRDVLRAADDVHFVFLDVDEATATERAQRRRDHFMGANMVRSQFEALERPDVDETDVLTVDAAEPVAEIVERALTRLGRP